MVFNKLSKMFQEIFKKVSRVFQDSFKVVSRKIEGCLKGDFSVIIPLITLCIVSNFNNRNNTVQCNYSTNHTVQCNHATDHSVQCIHISVTIQLIILHSVTITMKRVTMPQISLYMLFVVFHLYQIYRYQYQIPTPEGNIGIWHRYVFRVSVAASV